MNLYLIKRSPDRYVADTFSSMIIAADTASAARHIHPTKGIVWTKTTWTKGGRDYGFDIWTHPKNTRSRLIGKASAGTKAGMVCTSFNS